MVLTKVIVNTTTEGSDLVSALLFKNGVTGTTIIDKKDVEEVINNKDKFFYDYIDEHITDNYHPTAVIVVGVLDEKVLETATSSIKKDLRVLSEKATVNVGELTVRFEKVNDEQWQDMWKDFYKPVNVGKIVIYADWQKPKWNPFRVSVLLRPGIAFGTGSHPTTSMVIDLMQKIKLKGKSVADIGAGSGILGISAVKLGAAKAYLTDIDKKAYDDAVFNVKLNELEDKITVKVEDMIKEKGVKYDILLMNINADTLIKFADKVKNHLNEYGYIILSGIIDEKSASVKEAYGKQGFKVIKETSEDGWTAVLLR